jgi:hypothetical protein
VRNALFELPDAISLSFIASLPLLLEPFLKRLGLQRDFGDAVVEWRYLAAASSIRLSTASVDWHYYITVWAMESVLVD